ncbi:hypothetical protein P170DRAFT_438531 [Aspergillus steynii IBT 23096]|uniref:Extracellular membrane protein CFEM domain-containing protein n=1 Tax=Aspergillus steynii IBT 23096 TaxID=1392250 RepID=A0A2I2G1S8_9EURO|nr:uncharacterized protein P170DRAFT_438531 [Aspergillus steynii IBT 23096]PLB46826.1 hypothetical protein P170DRAFT_438531 [Aspergillus steynii IBT 23096]
MQLKSLLVLAASFSLATADYYVGNCGQGPDSTKEAPTKSACSAVEGTLCTGTGITRCVVDTGRWSDFTSACKKEGFDKTYQRPGSVGDLSTAKSLAACPRV